MDPGLAALLARPAPLDSGVRRPLKTKVADLKRRSLQAQEACVVRAVSGLELELLRRAVDEVSERLGMLGKNEGRLFEFQMQKKKSRNWKGSHIRPRNDWAAIFPAHRRVRRRYFAHRRYLYSVWRFFRRARPSPMCPLSTCCVRLFSLPPPFF